MSEEAPSPPWPTSVKKALCHPCLRQGGPRRFLLLCSHQARCAPGPYTCPYREFTFGFRVLPFEAFVICCSQTPNNLKACTMHLSAGTIPPWRGLCLLYHVWVRTAKPCGSWLTACHSAALTHEVPEAECLTELRMLGATSRG